MCYRVCFCMFSLRSTIKHNSVYRLNLLFLKPRKNHFWKKNYSLGTLFSLNIYELEAPVFGELYSSHPATYHFTISRIPSRFQYLYCFLTDWQYSCPSVFSYTFVVILHEGETKNNILLYILLSAKRCSLPIWRSCFRSRKKTKYCLLNSIACKEQIFTENVVYWHHELIFNS